MENISDEIIDVIKYATTMEINGRSFYEHAAEVTHNELGKKVFSKLADDEIGHMKTFSEIFTSVLGNEEWKKYLDQEELNKSTVLDGLKKRVEEQKKQGRAGDLEALKIGLELEKGSIDHYKKTSDKTNDPKLKEIFAKIIKEEEYHYDLLQAEYDSITNSGFWFDYAEFRMDAKY